MRQEQQATSERLIGDLRATRAVTLRRFGSIDPARLTEPHDWRGSQTDLRQLLAFLTEGSERRRIEILGAGRLLNRPRLTDAQHAMGIAGAMRGRLLGTLIGISDQLFEPAPAAGEWSLRQILAHVIAVDERYRIAVEYAVDRARRGGEGPLRPPDGGMPSRTGEEFNHGDPAELLERAQEVHDGLIRSISSVPDEFLDAPTNWAAWNVDVRFRLHRFAAHDREHGIQLRKTLTALGFVPSEPQLLLVDAQAELGTLEATLVAIGDAFIDLPPPGGGRTIGRIVEEGIAEESSI